MAKKTEANPKAPKKPNFFSNIKMVLSLVVQFDKRAPLFLAVAFAAPLLVFVIAAILTGLYFVLIPAGILVALIALMIVLSRLADKAGFAGVEGKPGASGAVLNSLKVGGILFEEQPVQVNPRTYDLIFRGTGRSGVILVTEGPINRVRPMVAKEIQRIKRVIPNVKIEVINQGNDEGQTPLKGLKKAVARLKPELTKDQLIAIRKRLDALPSMNIPIPKGMDPNKMKAPSRRALRGN